MTDPSHFPPAGAQPIRLRASVALGAAVAAFVAAAGAGVHLGLAPVAGPFGAAAAGALTAAALAVSGCRAIARRKPAELRIDAGAGGLAAFDRAGRLLARGRIVGCVQWSGWLLVLTVQRERGRAIPLLVPVDALDEPAFRALAVLGRAPRGGGASA